MTVVPDHREAYRRAVECDQEISGRYASLHTIKRIADELGLNRDAVRQVLADRGELVPGRPQRRRVRRADLTGCTYGRLYVEAMVGRAGLRRTHFRCRCACGSLPVVVEGSKLRNGHTRSCGCLARERARHRPLPAGESVRRRVLAGYRRNAARRDVPCTLTDEEMTALFQAPCHYCGCAPSTLTTHPQAYGAYRHNGIDRIDNARGYEAGNVVTACMECNFKRGAQDQQAFLSWIARVAAHQQLAAGAATTSAG